MRMPAIFGWALTFAFVDLSWVVFRAPDMAVLGRVWGAMFSSIPKIIPAITSDPVYLALLVAILLTAVPAYSYLIARRLQPNWWSAALAAVLLTTVVVRFSSVSYFLYYFF